MLGRVRISVGCLALGALLGTSGVGYAQSSCSGFIEPCVAKAVSLGGKAESYRPKCVREANACKKTGCFVGPTSRVTFACNLQKS
jgi:hypothetical protein